MSLPSLTLRFAPLCLIALLLGACQSPPRPTPVDPQLRQAWQTNLLRVLHRDTAAATGFAMTGAIDLRFVIDRQGRPVSCTTKRSKASVAAQVPADALPTDRKLLASTVEAQCWKAIFPLPPAAMYEGDTLEIVAPLIMASSAPLRVAQAEWRKAVARQTFFWQALLRDEPVDSIGLAEIRYQADASGQVTGCLVTLNPHPLRAQAFRLDGALQTRLTQRCLGLKVGSLPGFTAGLEGYSQVEYAPWKVGRD